MLQTHPGGSLGEEQAQLLNRARRLAGRTIAEVATELAIALPSEPKKAKGFIGMLVERALCAEAGSRPTPDFPTLGIELKTVPMSPEGVPRESTFVTTCPLCEFETLDWTSSRVFHKLSRVLFVPVESVDALKDAGRTFASRRFGLPLFFKPTESELVTLERDWVELAGALSRGETLTAHRGVALQIRPKAANSRALRVAPSTDDGLTRTLPVGFYLRRSFTAGVFARLLAELQHGTSDEQHT